MPKGGLVYQVPGVDAAYWLGSDTNGWLGVKMDDTKVYQLNPRTISFESLAGGVYKDVNLANIHMQRVDFAAAPTVAVNATAGNLNGNYSYCVTFTTEIGETYAGTTSATVSPANQQVDLSNIPVSANAAVTGKNIYRTVAGGSRVSYLVANIANATTTYTDNKADGDLGAGMPITNTTGGVIYRYTGIIAAADPMTTRFGYRALASSINYYNSAFGANALRSATTSSGCSAFGISALEYLTSGKYNCGFGEEAGYHITTGSQNAALSPFSLDKLTTGSQNVAAGYRALYANIIGDCNCAYGVSALQAALSSGNTSIGRTSLYSTTTGEKLTALGLGAGYTNTTGSSSVFLGYQAGNYETLSNKLYIDNVSRGSEAVGRTNALIYGVFDDAVANQALTFNAGSMGFFGHAAAAQPTKAGHNNWAAVSDVVSALVAIGIFDAA
jgi:hypothetical protein